MHLKFKSSKIELFENKMLLKRAKVGSIYLCTGKIKNTYCNENNNFMIKVVNKKNR